MIRIPSLRQTPPAYFALFCLLNALVALHWGEIDSSRWHLGAEYFNISQALVDGRGFADPFAEPTGPTAWMPPLLPALLASALWVFGSKSGVTIFAVAIAQVGYIVGATAVYRALDAQVSRLTACAFFVAYAVWLLTHRYWFLELSSDIWLVTLVMSLLVALNLNENDAKRLKHPVRWGLVGGLASLAAPAVLLPWLTSLALHLLRTRRALVHFAIAGGVACSIAVPWLVRNYLTFERLIPTKSNVGYELYQANVLDGDGIYDLKTMEGHPYNNFQSRFEYLTLGETQFISESGERFREHLRREPAEFYRRVKNRFAGALVLYVPLLSSERGPTLFWKRVLHVLPLLALGLGLSFRGRRHLLLGTAAIGLSYIAPYIIVAYYIRYSLPLLPIYALLSALCAEMVIEAWRRLPPTVVSSQEFDKAFTGATVGTLHRPTWENVAVLIPCLNEEQTIAGVVQRCHRALPGADVFVFDNASDDRTAEVAIAAGARVRHVSNRGKGNVVRHMFAHAEAEYVVLLDGDGTYYPEDAPKLLAELQAQKLDAVVGRRQVMDGESAYPRGHKFGNFCFGLALQVLFGSPLADPLSGYRVMRAECARGFPARAHGFEVETEMNIYFERNALRVAEVDVRYRGRPAGSLSKLSTWRDGLRIIKRIFHEKMSGQVAALDAPLLQ